jgi:hypothetical protein
MIDRSYSAGSTRALEPTVGRVTASDDRLDRFVAIQNGAPEREHRITTGDPSSPRQIGIEVRVVVVSVA